MTAKEGEREKEAWGLPNQWRDEKEQDGHRGALLSASVFGFFFRFLSFVPSFLMDSLD